MKRKISVILTFAMISLLFSGCLEKNDKQSNMNVLDIREAITLSYWVSNYSKSKDIITYNDMLIYKELEKRTGVHIDFRHPVKGNEKVEFDKMIASNDLADIIEWNWLLQYKGGPTKAIEDRKIIALNDYVDSDAPNLKKIMAQGKGIKKSISTYDNKIYVFPYLNLDPLTKIYNGPIMRLDWLEKLGLPVPKTIDDWYITLKAFKDDDPNSNGKKDEIPLSFGQMWSFIESNAFAGTWNVSHGFYLDQGKVKYGPIQPEYKQMIETLNRWYKEGLIDPVFDNNFSNRINVIGAFYGDKYVIPKYEISGRQFDSNMKLGGIAFPTLGANGKTPYAYMDYTYTGNSSAAITPANKYIKETVKWLDYAYSEEGYKLFNFGVENEMYKLEGNIPIYTKLVTDNTSNSVDYTMSKYFRSSTGGPYVLAKEYIEQYAKAVSPEVLRAINEWQKISFEHVIPFSSMPPEQTAEYNNIMNKIIQYQMDLLNKFITGAVPLDKFDEYIAEIRKMGIDSTVELMQDTVNRN